ncbi:hypothetical protein HMPREF1869_00655 [Bacteroidales bacterium KA00251]|nr:hypothetical protein HMPREF1869_00655 [Bacteroidales bacterium KA00251]
MYATKLFANIDALKESGEALPKALHLSPIPSDVIKLHEKRLGINLQSDETPLLAVNKKIIGAVGGYGWSGLLNTNKNIYYRLLKNAFFSSLIAIAKKGCIPMEQVVSLQIGNHDACFGTAYVGHQFLVNGKVLGLLRMGGGIEFDEKLMDILRKLFEDGNSSCTWGNKN